MSDGLLEDLKKTNSDDLTAGVAKSERLSGGTLEPIYSKRSFKCYTVTESELQQIGIANIGATFTSSIGSGFLAFWLDIYKDTALSENIPPTAAYVVDYVKPTCLYTGLVFWAFSASLLFWRYKMITTLKTESRDN